MIRLSTAVAPLALAACGLVAACGSAPPPPTLARAEQATQTARSENATAYAPQAMQAASDRLDAARRAVNQDKPNTAERLAQEALVNAEYAQARVAQAQAQMALSNVHRAAGGPALGAAGPVGEGNPAMPPNPTLPPNPTIQQGEVQ